MLRSISAMLAITLVVMALPGPCASSRAGEPPALLTQPANTWIKLSPLPDGPVSPRLGYEGACVWDSQHQLVVRYGGHNQGGGGEQGAEVWTFDPRSAKWTLKEPNTSPPGVCCNAQNVYASDDRPLHPLSQVQRQPRLAMVAGNLPERLLRLDVRSGQESLEEHASPANAASGTLSVRIVG